MSDLFILADYTLPATHNTPNIFCIFYTNWNFLSCTESQPALYGNVFQTIYVTIVRSYLRNDDLDHISYCCRILSWHFITSWLLIKHDPAIQTTYILYYIHTYLSYNVHHPHPTMQIVKIFSFSKSAVSSEYVVAPLL